MHKSLQHTGLLGILYSKRNLVQWFSHFSALELFGGKGFKGRFLDPLPELVIWELLSETWAICVLTSSPADLSRSDLRTRLQITLIQEVWHLPSFLDDETEVNEGKAMIRSHGAMWHNREETSVPETHQPHRGQDCRPWRPLFVAF